MPLLNVRDYWPGVGLVEFKFNESTRLMAIGLVLDWVTDDGDDDDENGDEAYCDDFRRQRLYFVRKKDSTIS